MAFDSSTKALLARASDFSRQALFLTDGLAPRRSEHFRGEPMEIVIATNTLRAMGDGGTFILNLQGAAPNRASETGTPAM
jgi:hypothetical protein